LIKVVVKDGAVITRSGTKNGKDWSMNTQHAWAQLPSKPYPVEIQITLAKNQSAFPVGEYIVDASAAWVSKFGDLHLDLNKMKPVKAA
jgi:hypothetical protein